jgi:uncharacterized protein involved in exopolysaccharide biosynthesis
MADRQNDMEAHPPEDVQSGPSLQEVIRSVWAARVPIAVITLAVAIITYLVNYFVLTPRFTATATLLPETEKSKLAALGQFADIAQLAGVNIPGSEISRLYPSIILSESILRNIIEKQYKVNKFPDPINLIQYFKLSEAPPADAMEAAFKIMRSTISASFDNRTSIVTLTAEMEDPQLAADVLNTAIDELDQFMRLKRITSASEQRKWIEARLKEVDVQLKASEETLKAFREQNRRVIDSPQLLMEQERLMREVQINSTLFIELKKQYELAKIEEIKNITIVNVLDRARPPAKRSSPKRAVNTMIMFMFAFIGSSGYFVIRSSYSERIRSYLELFGVKTKKTRGQDRGQA